MNSHGKLIFIFSLYIISAFHIHRSTGKKVIIKTASCAEFFERSVEDPDFRTTSWSSSRSYCAICNSRDVAKSWMVTKSTPVEGYNSVHIDVEMFRAKCSQCKNQTIQVYISGQSLPQTITNETIEMLENLRLIGTLSNKQVDSTEILHFQFQPKGLKRVSLLFLSAGSCTLINNINMSYFVCDKNNGSGVNLPEKIAPASGFERVNGSCLKNTMNPGNKIPYGLCSSKGEWTIISPCICKQGYTLDTVNEGCKKCPANTYKDTTGNEKCTDCPKNSKSFIGESQCVCNDNYYRFQGHNFTQPCYAAVEILILTCFRYRQILIRENTQAVGETDIQPDTPPQVRPTDYERPSQYAQFDSSKRVLADENYESLTAKGYNQLQTDPNEIVSPYTSLHTNSNHDDKGIAAESTNEELP